MEKLWHADKDMKRNPRANNNVGQLGFWLHEREGTSGFALFHFQPLKEFAIDLRDRLTTTCVWSGRTDAEPREH